MPPTEELTGFILQQIKRGAAHREIVYAVCQRSLMPWAEAESLVRQMEIENASRPTGLSSVALFVRVAQFAIPILIVLAVVIYYLSLRIGSGAHVLTYRADWPQNTPMRDWLGTWQRQFKVESDQVIVIHYDIALEAGGLYVSVRKGDSFIVRDGLTAVLAEHSDSKYLDASGVGELRVAVAESGDYKLSVNMWDFQGSYTITWELANP